MNATILNDDYLTLEYFSQGHVLVETWYGFIDYSRMVTVTPTLQQAVAKHSVSLALCDATKLKVLRPDVEDYMFRERLKQLAKTGLKHYAIVLKPETYQALKTNAHFLLERDLHLGNNVLKVRTFDSVKAAGAWLKQAAQADQVGQA